MPTAETVMSEMSDAKYFSKFGLGAVLLQKHGDIWAPVTYASRSLSKSEQNYAQIEKEALAILFGCERFHVYLYGKSFTIESP